MSWIFVLFLFLYNTILFFFPQWRKTCQKKTYLLQSFSLPLCVYLLLYLSRANLQSEGTGRQARDIFKLNESQSNMFGDGILIFPPLKPFSSWQKTREIWKRQNNDTNHFLSNVWLGFWFNCILILLVSSYLEISIPVISTGSDVEETNASIGPVLCKRHRSMVAVDLADLQLVVLYICTQFPQGKLMCHFLL